MGGPVVEAERCESVQEVFPDETPNETRGPAETTSSRERINDGFGTGGVVQEGFWYSSATVRPESSLESGFAMDVRLEDDVELIR